MSLSAITIDVPTSAGGTGAAADASELGQAREFVITGGAEGHTVLLQGSNDGVNWADLGRYRVSSGAAGTKYQVNDGSPYYRAKRETGSTAIVFSVSAAELAASSNASGSSSVSGSVATSDATPTAVASYTPSQDGSYGLTGMLIGRRVSDGATFVQHFVAAAKRVGGTVTAVGATTSASPADSSFSPAGVTLAVSGGAVLVRATGVAATSIQWQLHATVGRA
ncbi:hypothetical protein [Sorangium sp. So ce131]|uniref:hypothetical protein n=1 Tax=Sorangium sp. So ce131 TaxID=3133282 RepID=UPI003F616C7E